VHQVRAAGVPVDLQLRSGALHELTPGAELSVYRVVQEALTNVVKHAGPAAVRVEVRDEPDTLVIEVVDNGRGNTTVPDGFDGPLAVTHHGIVGMRERVALFGGTLSAGSRPEGGFGVLARMALDRATR
ncbi:MAG: sensor histidine kinase, partial [Acidimicrobiales bacterium]